MQKCKILSKCFSLGCTFAEKVCTSGRALKRNDGFQHRTTRGSESSSCINYLSISEGAVSMRMCSISEAHYQHQREYAVIARYIMSISDDVQ